MTDTTLAERLARCVRLRWEERARDLWTVSDDLGLHYAITNHISMDHPFKLEGRGGLFFKTSYHDTLEAAKAAAQADYTARILAALDMDALAREVEAMVRAEREACARQHHTTTIWCSIPDVTPEQMAIWHQGVSDAIAAIAAAIRAREGGKP
jgi:hypothetical protein